MGWSPKVNFQLRDDEVTFGDLIMDKNTASVLSQALVNIKEGKDVDNFPQILEYVYTDEEFSHLKDEFEEIKEDIKYFGSLLRGKGQIMPGIENFVGKVGATAIYAVGSLTWLEKYTNYLYIAGEAYIKLLKAGYQFTPEEAALYSKRYGEVLGNTTDTERIRASIDNQFAEDLNNLGYEQALKNKLENEKAAGLVNTGTAAMLESITKSVSATAKNEDAIIQPAIEGEVTETEEHPYEEMVVTSIDLIGLWIQVGKNVGVSQDPTEVRAKAATELLKEMSSRNEGFMDDSNTAGFGSEARRMRTLCSEYAKGHITDEICIDICSMMDAFVSSMEYQVKATIFDSEEYVVDKAVWDKLFEGEKPKITLTADMLIDFWEMASNWKEYVNDDLKRAGLATDTMDLIGNIVKNNPKAMEGSNPALFGDTTQHLMDLCNKYLSSDTPNKEQIEDTIVQIMNNLVTSLNYRNKQMMFDGEKIAVDEEFWNKLRQPYK